MKKIKKGCLFGCLVPIIILLLTFAVWTQHRHFYTVDTVTFTVWETWGGYAYITPYKYRRLFVRPQENYIRVRNLGSVEIFIGKDKRLYILNSHIHDIYSNPVEINLKKWDYEHFTSINTLSSIDSLRLKRNYFRDSIKLPGLVIDLLGSMRVHIWNYE